ncbi:MAG TPA: hypothetical protein VFJ12_14980 [Segeticoccus sp.]|jgi:hypothetical protein|nr:hypothetical protein [Segeticoccus sp.]
MSDPSAPAEDEPQPGPEAAERPSTGDADIDAALARLDQVEGAPLAEHIAAAERVHQQLQARLSDLGD